MSRTKVQFNQRKLTLDARPDRLDLRDRSYIPPVANLPHEFPSRDRVRDLLPQYIDSKAHRILDQGSEGACTGFGLAAVINYLFWARDGGVTQVSPRMAYHLAQFYDEWPGEDYSGSSCRGALKGWHKHGICTRSLWPYTVNAKGNAPSFEAPRPGWDSDAVTRPLGVYYRVDKSSVVDMQAALVEIGAIYVSADVHSGWSLHPSQEKFIDYDRLPMIEFNDKSKVSGGHAFAIVGYTAKGFVVQNSWGRDWGLSGFAVLTYADWVAHGSDAWTVSLGVPIQSASGRAVLRSPRAFSGAKGGVNALLVGGSGALPRPPGDKPYWNALEEADARERMVVMGNNGTPINRLVACANAEHSVAQVTRTNALDFFATHKLASKGSVKRVVLYAHGGLNSEEDSVVRTRVMASYFEANGIYPIFITWKSGAGEIIRNILQDRAKEVGQDLALAAGVLDKLKDAAKEVWDRAIEVMAQNLGVKSIWSEMKQNAMLGAQPGNALALIAVELSQLRAYLGARGHQLELHLIGHSAGSIVLGHMLDLFSAAANKQELGSCSLYAPACTVAFANSHYLPAVQSSKILAKDRFHISLLSDQREKEDGVGPYQKSLLYLVSRALEDMHKMPILGLLKAFDPSCNTDHHWNEPRLQQLAAELALWQQFWWGDTPPSGFFKDGRAVAGANFEPVHRASISTGARGIAPVHGSFDNDVDVVRQTLTRILGSGYAIVPAAKEWNLDY